MEGLLLWSAMPREGALGLFSAVFPFLFPFHGASGSLPLPPHPITSSLDLTFPRQFPSGWQPPPTGQTLGILPPFPSCMDTLDSLLSGLEGRTLMSPHTPTERMTGKDQPAYLLDSLHHFLDVGVVNFSLEPVDRIGVL